MFMTPMEKFRRFLWPAAGAAAVFMLSGCPLLAAPSADFSGSPLEGDAPLLVRFAPEPREGSGEIQFFNWDFGDGTQRVDERPVHTFESPGLYRISLTVSNANGSSTETKEAYVNVRAVPDVALSATPRTGNTPLTVQFRDESASEPFPATAWRWTFGDGEVSTEQHPVHQYVQPGAYDVSLTVTTDGGSRTLAEAGYIQVSAVPAAAFEASTTSGSAPLPVTFTDTSAPGTSAITSWFWEFGDGATSDKASPEHVYAGAGIYSVSLTVRNAAGESTVTETNLITVTQRPTAAFSGTPREGGAPLVVSFTDESAAGSSPITGWLWDFGDGTSSLERNPIHEFAAPGTYDIALTVTTDAGMDMLARKQYVVALAPPAADFRASVTRGEAPLSVAFSDRSEPGASPITGRQWNFGDGTFSGDAAPVHVYATPGRYTVTLRVTTAVGESSETKQDLIEVVARPAAAFEASPASGETPLTVNFTDLSSAGSSPITEWLWEFGDGTTSDAQHPERVYNAAGLYTVKLTVTTNEGTSTVTRNDLIRVVRGPRADFTATPTSGRAPLPVQFRDASDAGSEPVTARVWDFGDGTTSTAEDPSHAYTQPGIYTVSLTTTTSAGPDTERKNGFITVDPAVGFTLTPATGTVPATVTFTDTTDAAPLTIAAWAWDFGDGGTSTLQNPVHTYTEAGAYTVTLTITTEQGEAAAARTGAVRLRPRAAFSGEPLSGAGAPHTVQFTDETAPGNLAIRGWDWNFGDGTHSSQQNPSHTFTTPDVYDVTLTVLTDIGNSATTKTGYVVVRPEAAFSANVTSGVGSLAVQFSDDTDPGNLDILTWNWNFGDGTSSGLQNPAHTYTQPGTYTVALTTGSTEGPDTETKAGYITVAPNVTFTGSPLSGPAPLEVTFTDTTDTGLLEITARVWDFGDTNTGTGASPMHTYGAAGTYMASLTITTELGDFSIETPVTVLVTPGPAMEAGLRFAPDTVPDQGQAGVIFDLLADHDITLDSVQVYIAPGAAGGTVRCYTTPLTSVGRESDASAWTLRQTIAYDGSGVATIPLGGMALYKSESIGFYVVSDLEPGGSTGILYQTALPAGFNPIFGDGALRLYTGAGKGAGATDDFDGEVQTGSWFVGAIAYRHKETHSSSIGTNIDHIATDEPTLLNPIGLDGITHSTRTTDGGWVAIGLAEHNADSKGATLLVRCDASLQEVWSLDLRTLDIVEVLSLRTVADGGLLLHGVTSDPGAAPELFYVDRDGIAQTYASIESED